MLKFICYFIAASLVFSGAVLLLLAVISEDVNPSLGSGKFAGEALYLVGVVLTVIGMQAFYVTFNTEFG